jgi:hypothetical protein
LDTLADEVPEAGGVFLYEVAQAFGKWFAGHAHANSGLTYDSAIWDMMHRLIAAWV